MLSFSERMEQGKLLAQIRRNRGQPSGECHESWNYQRSKMSPLDCLYMETYRLESAYAAYKEWQYAAVAAVESALFAYELEETF